MSETNKKLVQEVYDDELFKTIAKDLSEEELKVVDNALNSFVELMAGPLVDQFQQALDTPEVNEEIKRQLRKSSKVVVK